MFFVVNGHRADSSVPLGQNDKAATIDVTVTGIKEDNTACIEVTVNVGAGLGNVVLYHKNVAVPAADYSYNNNNGLLRFFTTSFSHFTIVYTGEEPKYDDNTTPNADVTDITAEFVDFDWEAAWKSGKLLAPIGTQKLDAVYKFAAPHDGDTVL